MEDKILRHHKNGAEEQITQAGISETKIITSDDYSNISDPLAVKANVANKPGSSIPSIFGRMMFFHTALKNSRLRLSTNQLPSIYEKTVSEWLDLLEMIFNQSYKLAFVEWNKTEQVKALRESRHKILADTLENQIDKFFEGFVNNIYIIKEKDSRQILGATSPYTLVFTSPNWSSRRPLQLLLNRNKEFRIFLYRLADSMKHNSALTQDIGRRDSMTNQYHTVPNPAFQLVRSFVEFISRNREEDDLVEDSDVMIDIPGTGLTNVSSFDHLLHVYEEVESDINGSRIRIPVANLTVKSAKEEGGDEICNVGLLKLYQRPMSQIKSDMFIAGDVEGFAFDGEKTPLVLPDNTGFQNLCYYDGQYWEDGFERFPQFENKEEVSREMPSCEAYRHNYLSSIDFLEDKLVTLPYRMDSDKFRNVINTAKRSYLLPIKPKLLKYLKIDTILNNLKVIVDEDSKRIEVALGVPVRNNDGSRTNVVFFDKVYDISGEDVISANRPGVMEQPVSIGISPFVSFKLDKKAMDDATERKKAELNRHTVYLQYPNDNLLPGNITLDFLTEGNDAPLTEVDPVQRDTEKLKGQIFKLKGRTFDALQLRLDDVGGLIVPKFNNVTENGRIFYYAIDFGTTNTHIAYTDNAMSNAQSFEDKELHDMAVYLAEKPNVDVYLQTHTPMQLLNVLQNVYGGKGIAFVQEQARVFYPNFEQADYKFPIRTVSYEEQKVSDNVFGCLSIGFRYPKENFENPKYSTSLKWDLNKPAVADAQIKAQMFFEEILEIVRNHWLSTGFADLENTPTIMLTYPQAMGSSAGLKRLWSNAYVKVFGGNAMSASKKIKDMPESLAPAQKLIVKGGQATRGFLNVDIGGGTTDIQYYRKYGNQITAKYNSVLFAGDDLWGCGHENISIHKRDIRDNVFTVFADENMANRRLKIGLEEIDYSGITLKGKEKINLLLRDEDSQFSTMITQTNNGNTAAKKVLLLHYAAILYHIANWIMADPDMKDDFPAVMTFTGFGSKYIEILFGEGDTGNSKLVELTVKLLKAFGVTNIPEDFKVEFDPNPKAATAEGAALFASRNDTKNIPLRPAYHYGSNKRDPKKQLKLNEVKGMKPEVSAFFDNFVEGVKSVTVNEVDLNLPTFTDSEFRTFRNRALRSYDNVCSTMLEQDETEQSKVSDSLFFWTLKDSLYEFHTY